MDAFDSLQSILDVANKTLSRDQLRLLVQEIQQTTGDALRSIGPSDQPKDKSSRCDGEHDSSMKRQLAPNVDMPFDLKVGRFKCGCGEWVSLRDETEFTLAPWIAHLPVCKQSNATGTISRIAPSDIAEDSISKSNFKGASPASCFKGHSASDRQKDYNSASLRPRTTPSSSLEVLQTAECLVTAAKKPEVGVSPSSERRSGSEEPPSTQMPWDPTESRSDVLKLFNDSHPKQSLSQPTRQDSLSRRRRNNRTEAQRIQEFHADPFVAVVEPFRVRCALCNKWIKLRPNSRYCTIPWKCHRESCKRLYSVEVISSSAPAQRSLQDLQLHFNNSLATQGLEDTTGSSQPSVLDSSTASSPVAGKANLSNAAPSVPSVPPPSTIHPSLQLPRTSVLVPTRESYSKIANSPIRSTKSRVYDAEQRRATLQNDPNTEAVEPYRVLCALCQRWVKLRLNSTYCSAPWYTHIRRCVHREKRVNAATGSTCGNYPKTPEHSDNSNPDNPSGNQACDLEQTQGPEFVDGPVSFSRHNMASSTLKESSLSEQLKKRDGRRSSSTSLETRHNTGEDSDDEMTSEVSYESEEQ